MDEKTKELLIKSYLKSYIKHFKILDKGLREQQRYSKRKNANINRRINFLKEKYIESTTSDGLQFMHEDGNLYWFGCYNWEPVSILSKNARHLYLARAFMLGIPYKKVEQNSKTANLIEAKLIEKHIDIILTLADTGCHYYANQENCWNYLISQYKTDIKHVAILKWLGLRK